MDISDDDGAQKSRLSNRKRKINRKDEVESAIKKPCSSRDLSKESENDENDVFAGLSKEYRATSGMKDTFHGTFYQVKIIFLFLKRAIDLKCNFRLATEMDAAEKFDDLVFEFRNENNDIECRALQAKHKQNEDDKITLRHLLDEKEGDFSLKKYFISYLEMKRNVEFKKMEVKDFIIMTNIDFNEKSVKKSEILTVRNESDPALDFRFKSKNPAKVPVRYRINPNQDMINTLSRCSRVYLLAKKLVKNVFINPKKLKVSDFKDYHVALCEHVIDNSAGKFKRDFVLGKNLPDEVKSFRELFLTFGQKLTRSKKIILGKSFGVKAANKPDEQHLDLPKDKIEQNEIDDFFEKLIFAVYQPNEEELGQLIDDEIGEELNLSYSKDVADQVLVRLLNWFKSKTGTFLYPESKSFFDEPKRILSSRVTIGLVMRYVEKLKTFDRVIRFKEPERETLIQFLNNESNRKYLIQSDEPLLTLIKMYQCINEHETYKKVDNYVIINLTFLMNKNVEKCVVDAFGSANNANLLVINFNYTEDKLNENAEAVTQLFSQLSNRLENPSKKLLIVIKKQINLPIEFYTTIPFETKSDETKFNNLDKESRKILLDKKVNFLGNEMRLGEFSEDKSAWNVIIDSNVIVKLMKGEDKMHEIGRAPMRLCELEAAYIKRYEVIETEHLTNILVDKLDKHNDVIFVIAINYENDVTDLEKLIKLLNITNEDDENKIRECANTIEVKNVNIEGKKINILNCGAETQTDIFKRFCFYNYEKVVYWVKIDNEKLRLLQIYNPNFYLKRKLRSHKTIYKNNILDLVSQQTLVFSGANQNNIIEKMGFHSKIDAEISNLNEAEQNSEKERLINVIKNNVFASFDEEDVQKTFEDWCKDPDKSLVHWFNVESDQFTLRESHLIKKNSYDRPINEEQLAKRDNKVVIVVAEPGMGKSTTLTHLSQYKLSDNWVIRLNLKDYQDEILRLPNDYTETDRTIESVVYFLMKVSKVNLNRKLTVKLLKYFLSHQMSRPLLVLFDGYDEIDEFCQRKIILLMKYLQEKTFVNLWITSRKQCTPELEVNLGVLSTRFKEMLQDERVQFLKNLWKVCLKLALNERDFNKVFENANKNSKFQLFSNALLKKVTSFLKIEGSDFMGIPLQMRLLGEAFLPEFEKFIRNPLYKLDTLVLSINDIYERFFNVKIDIYFQEKTGLSVGLNEVSKKWFSEMVLVKLHQKLGLKLLFPDKYKTLLGEKSAFTENEEIELKRIGIVHSTQHSDQLEFIHRTFAEYFVAGLILNWLRKPVHIQKFKAVENLLQVIFENHPVICTFLNKQILESDLTVVKIGSFGPEILKSLGKPSFVKHLKLIKLILSFFTNKIWLLSENNIFEFLEFALKHDQSQKIVTFFLKLINRYEIVSKILFENWCIFRSTSCKYEISNGAKKIGSKAIFGDIGRIKFKIVNCTILINAIKYYPVIFRQFATFYILEDLIELFNGDAELSQMLEAFKNDKTNDPNTMVSDINTSFNLIRAKYSTSKNINMLKKYVKHCSESMLDGQYYWKEFAYYMSDKKPRKIIKGENLENLYYIIDDLMLLIDDDLPENVSIFLDQLKNDETFLEMHDLLKKFTLESTNIKTNLYKITDSLFESADNGNIEKTEQILNSCVSIPNVFLWFKFYDRNLRSHLDKTIVNNQQNVLFFIFDRFKSDPIISMHMFSIFYPDHPEYLGKLLDSVECGETKKLMNSLLDVFKNLNVTLSNEKLKQMGQSLLERIENKDIKTLKDILDISEQDAGVSQWLEQLISDEEGIETEDFDVEVLRNLFQLLAEHGNLALYEAMNMEDAPSVKQMMSCIEHFPALCHLLLLKCNFDHSIFHTYIAEETCYSILEFMSNTFPKTVACFTFMLDGSLCTTFHYALQYDYTKILKLLFKILKPYPNVLKYLIAYLNEKHKSSVHCAILDSSAITLELFLRKLSKNVSALKYVVEHFVSDEEDKFNLYEAAVIKNHLNSLLIFLNSLKVSKELFKSFFIPVNKNVKPSFYLAGERGCKEVVDSLLSCLEREPKVLWQLVTWSDLGSGKTVLHRASEKGYTEIVDALLTSVRYNPEWLRTLFLYEDNLSHSALDCAILSGEQIIRNDFNIDLREGLIISDNYRILTQEIIGDKSYAESHYKSFSELSSIFKNIPMVVNLILIFAKCFNNVELMLAIFENENLKVTLENMYISIEGYSYHLFVCAIESNNSDLVELLIKKGIDVNSTNDFGATPLMRAVHKKSVDIIKLLKENGVEVHATDMNGQTAVSIAIDNNDDDLYKLLTS